MNSLHSYLKLLAAHSRKAVPKANFRHVHLSNNPIVITGYHLAGDVGAPLALMWGTDPNTEASCVVIPEPRDRKCRFEALDEFSCALIEYFNTFSNTNNVDDAFDDGPSFIEAPQIVVPNKSTAEWLFGIVGRFTRHLRTDSKDGELTAPHSVPLAGKHLSFFHDLLPGSSLVLPVTELLSTHWQSGQLASEDLNLSAALGWILPENGLDGPGAARRGEKLPPAGPISDPNWDANNLVKIVKNWHEAKTNSNRAAIRRELEAQVREQLNHTWDECWSALRLLESLPEARSVANRWERDCAAWDKHKIAIDLGETRFRNIPTPVQSARTLKILESCTADLDAEMALDDPLVMAAYIASGEALSAQLLNIDITRKIIPDGKKRKVCRPLLVLEPNLPFTRPIGSELFLASDPSVELEILSTKNGIIHAQVNKGANSSSTFARLPNEGESIVLSPFKKSNYYPSQQFDEIPWTHCIPEHIEERIT